MAATKPTRVAWVDYARGLCIILVVMMHSTLGVEAALGQEGFLHAAVVFAKPFRIPAFFLVSGLLLARVIDRDWRTFLDGRVVHFVYFYVLWLTIIFAFRFPVEAGGKGVWPVLGAYLEAFVQPFGALWFIYLLPIFFVAAKLTRRIPPPIVWFVAAGLEMAPVDTGIVVIDEFTGRFVYFYSGYVLAPHVFRFADLAVSHRAAAIAGLALWAVLNGALVTMGWSELALVSLALGFLGAAAIVTLSALLARQDALTAIGYCGQHSLVIYVAFVLPMAAARIGLIKSGVIADAGLISMLVTAFAIIVPLALHWAVCGSRLRFLFERPQSLRFARPLRLAPQR